VNGVIGLGGGSALDAAKVAALLGAHGGRVRDYQGSHPLAGEGRFVPHGIACALTAHAAFGVTHAALPDRHREATRLLTGREPDPDDPNPLGAAMLSLMKRIGTPTRLADVGYDAEDVPALVAGAEKQHRLLSCAPLPVDGRLLERVFRESL